MSAVRPERNSPNPFDEPWNPGRFFNDEAFDNRLFQMIFNEYSDLELPQAFQAIQRLALLNRDGGDKAYQITKVFLDLLVRDNRLSSVAIHAASQGDARTFRTIVNADYLRSDLENPPLISGEILGHICNFLDLRNPQTGQFFAYLLNSVRANDIGENDLAHLLARAVNENQGEIVRVILSSQRGDDLVLPAIHRFSSLHPNRGEAPCRNMLQTLVPHLSEQQLDLVVQQGQELSIGDSADGTPLRFLFTDRTARAILQSRDPEKLTGLQLGTLLATNPESSGDPLWIFRILNMPNAPQIPIEHIRNFFNSMVRLANPDTLDRCINILLEQNRLRELSDSDISKFLVESQELLSIQIQSHRLKNSSVFTDWETIQNLPFTEDEILFAKEKNYLKVRIMLAAAERLGIQVSSLKDAIYMAIQNDHLELVEALVFHPDFGNGLTSKELHRLGLKCKDSFRGETGRRLCDFISRKAESAPESL